jgi:hypothetical protein
MFVDDPKNIIKISSKDDRSLSEVNEKQIADQEFLKSVQKALEFAINENEEVSIFLLMSIYIFTYQDIIKKLVSQAPTVNNHILNFFII